MTRTLRFPTQHTEPVAAARAVMALCDLLRDESERDITFELLYLETLLGAGGLSSPQLSAWGPEFQLEAGLLARRRRSTAARTRARSFAGRAAVAAVAACMAAPYSIQSAQAMPGQGVLVASAPVVKVIDAATGQGIAGVRITTMDEKLLGLTDASGQATLSDAYKDSDLLSLQKSGYQVYLLERNQLASRNVVSLKPSGKTAPLAVAHAPVLQAPTAPVITHQVGRAPTFTPPRPPVLTFQAHVAGAVPSHQPTPMALPHVQPSPKALPKPLPVAALPMAAPNPKPGAMISRKAVTKASAAAPKEKAAITGHVVHVRAGDTLSGLAFRQWGRASLWSDIYAANRDTLRSPAYLRIGQTLVIPADPAFHVSRASHATTGAYVVRSGDSLYTIAQAQFGSGAAWPRLYRLNEDRVHNPRLIFPGERLRLS